MGFFSKKKDESSSSGIHYLIVGLGNPDKKYENTRHNAGFMAVDAIAKKYNARVDRVKFKALTGTVEIAGEKCLLMKPLTYMNLSGQAVVEAMNFYKIPMENILVFFDDISLEPGKIRIRRKGSHGGHNGIKNIIYLTGQDNFPRVKLGVGKKPHPDYDLADWVLSHFDRGEMEQMQRAFDRCPEIVRLVIEGRMDQAMNLHNS